MVVGVLVTDFCEIVGVLLCGMMTDVVMMGLGCASGGLKRRRNKLEEVIRSHTGGLFELALVLTLTLLLALGPWYPFRRQS